MVSLKTETLISIPHMGAQKAAVTNIWGIMHVFFTFPRSLFRQSCIYGKRQFGIEDQGWVAWFVIASILNKTISIYGDGKQVRDLLFVDDLLNAYDLAIETINKVEGQVFNLGGGKDNSISIWCEFQHLLEKVIQKKINFKQIWNGGRRSENIHFWHQ